MNDDTELTPQDEMPSRRRPAHGVLGASGEMPIVYLTVCTKNREPWLATLANHALLREIWLEATAWLVGRYVLMHEHLHMFVTPGTGSVDLDAWVQYWKSQFTRRHGVAGHRWQAGHWDTRLRDPAHYDDRWQYTRDNPKRKGLVDHADDWPYQGELFDLRWD